MHSMLPLPPLDPSRVPLFPQVASKKAAAQPAAHTAAQPSMPSSAGRSPGRSAGPWRSLTWRPSAAGVSSGRRRLPRSSLAGRSLVTAVVAGSLLWTMPAAEAGWFDWLWPASHHEQLERAVDVAQQTAASACQLVESHSQQAAAQSDQNARVAELLGALAVERQSLADHVARFEERSQRDSVVAAAISAAVPAVVSSAAFLLGAVAIWAVTRPSPLDAAVAADVFELVAALPAADGSTPGRNDSDGDRPQSGPGRRLRDASSTRRLAAEPACELRDAEDGDVPF